MKQTKFIPIILLAALVVSCSTPFKIVRIVDVENPNMITYKSSPIKIKGNTTSDTYDAFLRYFAYVDKNERSYAFDILYRGGKWGIFTKVKLKIAGVKSEYAVKSPPLRTEDGLQGLTEELIVKIPNEKIQELIENRKCKMTVVGQYLKIEVNFKQVWFDKLIKFYAAVNKNK